MHETGVLMHEVTVFLKINFIKMMFVLSERKKMCLLLSCGSTRPTGWPSSTGLFFGQFCDVAVVVLFVFVN